MLLRRPTILLRMVSVGLRCRADVYHAHDLNTLPASVLCKIVRPRPLIYDSHEVATGRVGHDVWYMRLLEKACLPFCNRVIHTTLTRARHFANMYCKPVPAVVGNVIDLSLASVPPRNLHEELLIPREEPIVIYQGGVQAGRGIEQALQSMKLWNRGHFVIVGDGALFPHIKSLVSELGLEERVRLVGRVPVQELLGYTKGADLGLQVLQNTCFNHYSTDSNKLFEYFAAGLPVVAADFPEIRGLVEPRDLGLLVDPHDPSEIAWAVNSIFSSNDQRQRFAKNAQRAAGEYNWQQESAKLLDVYHTVLAKRAHC